MSIAYISVGTNLGNKLENIKKAYKLLQTKTEIINQSSIYKTIPQEMCYDAPMFLNSVVKIKTNLSPYELLSFLKNIEVKLGRTEKNNKKSRTIDLDIILYDNQIINSKELTIPHPRMIYRDFVVYPLLEIEPNIIYPLNRLPLKECIQHITPEKITKYADSNFNVINNSTHKSTNC